MQIQGTAEEREAAAKRKAARRARTAARRGDYYRGLLAAAAGQPQELLRHACDYLRAIANDSNSPAAVTAIAVKVAQLADEESKK